jgi:hypothetical protein
MPKGNDRSLCKGWRVDLHKTSYRPRTLELVLSMQRQCPGEIRFFLEVNLLYLKLYTTGGAATNARNYTFSCSQAQEQNMTVITEQANLYRRSGSAELHVSSLNDVFGDGQNFNPLLNIYGAFARSHCEIFVRLAEIAAWLGR